MTGRRGRKRIPDDRRMSATGVKLPKDLHDAASRLALRDATTIADLLRKGLRMVLRAHGVQIRPKAVS